jgi:hypothetical protein
MSYPSPPLAPITRPLRMLFRLPFRMFHTCSNVYVSCSMFAVEVSCQKHVCAGDVIPST